MTKTRYYDTRLSSLVVSPNLMTTHELRQAINTAYNAMISAETDTSADAWHKRYTTLYQELLNRN